jgi:carbon storage regulator
VIQAASHNNGGFVMLVLSRKIQESVVVGGSDRFERMLKVTVLEIKGGKVRLGFEADSDVPVHRAEVWERIVASCLLDGQTASPAAPYA